jgi:hypothetical protein
MLAKHALSQLSYGPAPEAQKSESQKSEARTQTFWLLISGFWLLAAGGGWWVWEDLNLRPHAYQARARARGAEIRKSEIRMQTFWLLISGF